MEKEEIRKIMENAGFKFGKGWDDEKIKRFYHESSISKIISKGDFSLVEVFEHLGDGYYMAEHKVYFMINHSREEVVQVYDVDRFPRNPETGRYEGEEYSTLDDVLDVEEKEEGRVLVSGKISISKFSDFGGKLSLKENICIKRVYGIGFIGPGLEHDLNKKKITYTT